MSLFPFFSHFNSNFVFFIKKENSWLLPLHLLCFKEGQGNEPKIALNFAGAEFLLNFLFMINIILLSCPSIMTKIMHTFA